MPERRGLAACHMAGSSIGESAAIQRPDIDNLCASASHCHSLDPTTREHATSAGLSFGVVLRSWNYGRKPKMASEPTEEAIENFVSFTSTTREQAISFLKVSSDQLYALSSNANQVLLSLSQANELNSNKAINAYFEDPTGPQTQVKCS